MNLQKALRIQNWWASHYGTMVGFIYLILTIGPSAPPLYSVLQTFSVFTLASLGIGVFGHLLNDLADVDQDSRSGARNVMLGKTAVARCLLLAGSLLVGLVPWIWLPWTPLILGLLAAEFLLFILYSLPPFRLKNRGILGPIADALYGYVIPNAVAVLLFAQLAGGTIPTGFLTVIVLWCFLFGLERIVHHQLLDADRDEIAGVRTLVVARGWEAVFRFSTRRLVPALVVAMLVLIGMCGSVSFLVPLGFALHLGLTLRAWSHCGIQHTCRLDRLPPMVCYHVLAQCLIATFVWRWFALLTLSALVIKQPHYWPIVPLQLLFFPEALSWITRVGIPESLRITKIARADSAA